MALVATAFATIATQPAAPTESASVELPIAVTRDSPVVARRIHVSIDHGGNPFGEAALLVTDHEDSEVNPGIWVSIVPQEPTEPVSSYSNYFGVYDDHDLSDACDAGCDRSYIVLARMRDPLGSAITDSLGVELRVTYEGEGGDAPEGATADLALDPEPLDPAQYTSVQVGRKGSLRVGHQQVRDGWIGELIVPAAALAGYDSLGYPLVGRVQLVGSGAETGESQIVELRIKVGVLDAFGSPSADYSMDPIEIDWLAACEIDRECRVPIEVSLVWELQILERGNPSPGSLRFDYQLDVTLEYLDRSVPPAGAQLVIEEN